MTTALAIKSLSNHSSSLAEISYGSIGDGFFKSVDTETLADLFEQYRQEKLAMTNLCQFMEQNKHQAFHRLMSANIVDPIASSNLFQLTSGVAYLNSLYWDKALTLTDVKEYMSAKAKKEWNEQIEKRQTPEFKEDSVIPTLRELLVSRDMFLAETVDAIFQGLSGSHLTNTPQGFNKKMIMPSLYGKGEAEPAATVKDLICDLRHIINKLLGRAGTGTKDTGRIINACRNNMGQWCEVDGGALRMKVYKVGTVHLEIHPDMAWRLNKVLAILYPMAIPPKFRKPQKYSAKQVNVKQNLIGRGAIFHLSRMKKALKRPNNAPEWSDDRINALNTYRFDVSDSSMGVNNNRKDVEEAAQVLIACGLKRVHNDYTEYAFEAETSDFDFQSLVDEVVRTGYVPEQQSHQFYPTQDALAEEAAQWCEIEDEHSKLEPSAGQGHLALKMGNNVTCVELSSISCSVLKAKGLHAIAADFLTWSETAGCYDRILMNPPFSEGRAIAHFNAAVKCLATEGILVAILPASVKGKLHVEGASIQYSRVIENAFTSVGTHVSVIMVKIIK